MGNLILNSLEIRNFRGFQHLTIEHLGRVNLIVGKNNIGKSSLLEALQLYARRGSRVLIWNILGNRDESRLSSSNLNEEVNNQLSALKYMFYGRKDFREKHEAIQIGPIDSLADAVTINVGWSRAESDSKEIIEYNPVDELVPRLIIQFKNRQGNYTLNGPPISTFLDHIKHIFVGAEGLNKDEFGELWDNIALTGLENEVLDVLRIVAPGVEGLNFRDDYTPTSSLVRERIAIVKIEGIDEPLPLRSLGDGNQRMLGIALALANTKDGIVLIDEIENGIHYSAQTELWHLIFRLAHRLNVQVFATTHSWDCIEGFAKAAQKDTQEQGMLIRLSLKKEKIAATLFDEEDLAVVTREQIEVR